MTFMRKMCLDATSTYVYNHAQDVLWRYLFMRSRVKVISKMCIEAASYLQSARCLLCEVVDYKVHLHAQGAGSLQQQWALMCNGYFWLIWDHFCWQTVPPVLIVLGALHRAEKEVDHCTLPAYYFYYSCYYFCSNNACFSLSLWGLIYLNAMFTFG